MKYVDEDQQEFIPIMDGYGNVRKWYTRIEAIEYMKNEEAKYGYNIFCMPGIKI